MAWVNSGNFDGLSMKGEFGLMMTQLCFAVYQRQVLLGLTQTKWWVWNSATEAMWEIEIAQGAIDRFDGFEHGLDAVDGNYMSINLGRMQTAIETFVNEGRQGSYPTRFAKSGADLTLWTITALLTDGSFGSTFVDRDGVKGWRTADIYMQFKECFDRLRFPIWGYEGQTSIDPVGSLGDTFSPEFAWTLAVDGLGGATDLIGTPIPSSRAMASGSLWHIGETSINRAGIAHNIQNSSNNIWRGVRVRATGDSIVTGTLKQSFGVYMYRTNSLNQDIDYTVEGGSALTIPSGTQTITVLPKIDFGTSFPVLPLVGFLEPRITIIAVAVSMPASIPTDDFIDGEYVNELWGFSPALFSDVTDLSPWVPSTDELSYCLTELVAGTDVLN